MADVHLETRAKYFILRNEPIASGRRFGDSMNACRPMELGARSWAIAVAAALFFLVVGAALGQQDATTPTPPSFFGSEPTWSSSDPTVATNPRLVASSAMVWARPSAVPRLEPYSTSSGIWCASEVGVGAAAGWEATTGREAVNGGVAVRPPRSLTLM